MEKISDKNWIDSDVNVRQAEIKAFDNEAKNSIKVMHQKGYLDGKSTNNLNKID